MSAATLARGAIAVIALFAASPAVGQAAADGARCDSAVRSAAAVVDSVRTAMFLTVQDVQGTQGALMTDDQRDLITSRIVHYFVPPSPFRISVFDGPALARGIRISGSDSLGVPRGPSIVGTYRLEVTEHGPPSEPEVLRSSLMRGLDSAVVRAIRAGAGVGTAFRPVIGDRWRLLIRVTVDSLDGSQRLAEGTLPRMRIRDAEARSIERPAFPDDARADSVDHGEVVLRFVVDRDGMAALETVELVHSTGAMFTRAALRALASQKFEPATIGGCPVAQAIEFPFIFDATERTPRRAP